MTTKTAIQQATHIDIYKQDRQKGQKDINGK